MPQMSPLNWMNISLTFIIMTTFLMISIFFLTKSKSSIVLHKKKESKWMWMW